MHWSFSIIRRWNNPFKSRVRSAASTREELQKRKLALDKKEKELLKKERLLRQKYKKYKHPSDHRTKADLKAANKLKRARKKLISVLDSADRLKQSKKKHKVSGRIQKRKLKPKQKGNKGFINALTGYPFQCFNDLLNKPCYCDPGKVRRLRAGEAEPSLLRRICGGTCDCSPTTGRKNTDRHRNILGMCRCELKDTNRYGAGDCYLMSLRQTPQLWIHHRWPRFYPHYLDARHHWKNFSYCLLFCAGILVWTPCILCLEISKCFCCACCSD